MTFEVLCCRLTRVALSVAVLVGLSGCNDRDIASGPPTTLPQKLPWSVASTSLPQVSQTAVPVTAIQFADLRKPGAGLSEPTLASSASLKLWRGEARGMILRRIASCSDEPIGAPLGVSIELFSMPVFTTRVPSAIGLKAGEHFDPLVPTSLVCGSTEWVWADIIVSKTAAPGRYRLKLGDLPVDVEVQNDLMPDRPKVPLYIGFQPFGALLGHKLDQDSRAEVQGPLVKQYVDLLRAHRIEPFGQFLKDPEISDGIPDIDEWRSERASFRQLVIDGAIAPPMVLSGPFVSDVWKTPRALKAWERLVKSESALRGAWVYVTDEPCEGRRCGNNPDPGLRKTKERAQLLKTNAPSLRRMVTHKPDLRLSGVIDVFVPQLEDFTPGNASIWLYGACPSHGSCANETLGSNTGTPDLMLDQASIHPRAYPIVAAALGGQAILYYTANEAYGRLDVWSDQYLFGGNGDGQLVYPGIEGERGFDKHQPVASIRLKLLRQGMFDVERLYALGRLRDVVQSATSWLGHEAIDLAAGR